MSKEAMNCKEICSLLTAYLDGEVTPEERAKIETHLPGCPPCRAELEALAATQTSLRGALKSAADKAILPTYSWEKVRGRLGTGKTGAGSRPGFTFGRVAAAVAAVFVVVIAIFIWQYGGNFKMGSQQPATTIPTTTPTSTRTIPMTTSGEIPPPSTIEPPARFIQTGASFEKETFAPGEPVNVAITFTNITAEPYEISPFPPLVKVMRAGSIDDVIYEFTAGTGVATLQPDQTIKTAIAWNQTDSQGQPVPWGQYLLLVPGGGTLKDSKVLGQIYILPPEGVIEGTIGLDQSKTVDGITFTLKKVELTTSGPRFLIYNATFRDPEGPPKFDTVLAQYSLDGGPVRETRPVFAVGGGSEIYGYDYVWFMSIPVPQGTKEITFTITKFSEWEGPWEFKIPLE